MRTFNAGMVRIWGSEHMNTSVTEIKYQLDQLVTMRANTHHLRDTSLDLTSIQMCTHAHGPVVDFELLSASRSK